MNINFRFPLILGLTLFLGLGSPLLAENEDSIAYQGAKKDLHIYLLIGQSNMAGRAKVAKGEDAVLQNTFLLNGQDQWEPAKNPLNRYSTIRKGLGMQKLNPGYSFSKTMLKKMKGSSIGLVVNAKGGSNINDWVPGSKFFQEAIKRTKAAMKSGSLKGILWHQGESNAKDEKYLDKLSALVKNLRRDLGEPSLPFIAGQVNNVPLVNEQIAKLPSVIQHTSFVKSDGLQAMDRWHFDAKSMKMLGERYAKEMLRLLKK
jgi:hypothetical protein